MWAGGPVGPCWPGCQRRGVTRGRRVEGGAEVGSALRARLTACTPVLLAKIVTSHDRPAARRLTGRRPWRTRVRRTGNVRRQLAVPRARCQSRRPIGGEECTRVGVPHGDTAARRCRPVHRVSTCICHGESQECVRVKVDLPEDRSISARRLQTERLSHSVFACARPRSQPKSNRFLRRFSRHSAGHHWT